jgi:hypothetical protein
MGRIPLRLESHLGRLGRLQLLHRALQYYTSI